MGRIPSFANPRSRSTRFTIGSLMIVICVIALVLTALRPLAGLFESAYPSMAAMMKDLGTAETGIVLTCLVVGAFVTVKLMSYDETAS